MTGESGMVGLWNKHVREGALGSRNEALHFFFFFKSSRLPCSPHTLSYFAVLPQLVALHAVAVVEGDGAGVGDGIEAELLGVLGVSRPDVLSPGEGEHLYTQAHREVDSTARGLSFFVTMGNFKHRSPEKSLLTTPVPVTQL